MVRRTKSLSFNFLHIAAIGVIFLGSAFAQAPVIDASLHAIKAPLAFEPNLGQAGLDARYLTRGSGYNIGLQSAETTIMLGSARPGPDKSALVRMKMLGARADAPAFATNELPGHSNYLVGNDPSKWLNNIPLYGNVRFENVYDGIDTLYYGTDGKLEFDFVVAPGADPRVIQFAVDGADRIGLINGDLSISTRAGDLTLHKPFAYQDVDGVRRPIESSYVIDKNQRIGFHLAAYDTTRPLVIDPQLSYLWDPYSSMNFIDIGEWDRASGIAFRPVTGGQEVFVTGSFKNFNSAQAIDAFVGKFASDGSLQYRTVIGGDGDDFGLGIAPVSTGTDAGKVFVTGMTASSNFPCKVYAMSNTGPSGCSGTNLSLGSSDGFIMKLNTSGLLDAFSRRIGGALADRADSVVVIPTGSTYEVHVAGAMQSDLSLLPASGFSASYALLPTDWNGYVVKVDGTTGALSLGRYFGPVDVPQSGDPVRALKVASDGNPASLYVAGTTSSTLPCSGICTPAAGNVPSGTKAFVVKVVNGAISYVTHIGGTDTVYGTAAAPSATATYVSGSTMGNLSLPCPSGACTRGQGMDAFVAKLDINGVPTQFTYLGADSTDNGMDVVLDSLGNPFVTGDSANPAPGTEFPIQGGSRTNPRGGGIDAFITKLNPNLGVVSTTFIGRAGDNTADYGKSLVTTGGITYATGFTFIPGTFGYSFVAKLDENAGFALDRVELNPTSVTGGTTPVNGTVYLLCPSGPPASTQAVNMSFSPSTAGITITPNPVNIVNACSGTFTVGTTAVSAATTVTITATLGSSTKSKDLTINPPKLIGLSLDPSTVNGGQNSTATITLDGPTPPGGVTVSITSTSSGSVIYPSTVLVNDTTAPFQGTFTIGNTSPSATTSVTFTAALNGGQAQSTLTIRGSGGGSGGGAIKFKDFDVDVVFVDLKKGDDDDNFFLRGEFTLGDRTDGINPVMDQVTLQINNYTLTIPPNSFRKDRVGDRHDDHDNDDHDNDDDRDSHGSSATEMYRFFGTINGDRIYIVIRGFGHNEYTIWAFGHRADLTRVVDTTPVTVNLVIGNDSGTATDTNSKIRPKSKKD